MSEMQLSPSFAALKSLVEACLRPTEAWLKTAFRHYLGRDEGDLEAASRDFAQTLVQIDAITALLLSYRVEQLALPRDRQDRSVLTPERLDIPRSSLLYHPARRALAPVTVITRLKETATSHSLLNGTDELYSAGRRLEDKIGKLHIYECRFGYGALDTRGRETWTTLPNGAPIRCVNDQAPHAANPWTCRSYEVGKLLKFIRKWGIERCVGYTYLCDEQKCVIAQHRLLFLPLYGMDIDTDPRIEMRLSEGVLEMRSGVFVCGVFLEGQETGNLTDNAFDLLPGIPYSLPWDEAVCGTPQVVRTGNGLLRKPNVVQNEPKDSGSIHPETSNCA